MNLYVSKTGMKWRPQLKQRYFNATTGKQELQTYSLSGLTTSDFSLYLYNPTTNTTKAGTGTWSGDSTNGFAYQWTDADLSTTGTWLLYLSVKDVGFDPVEIEIKTWIGA